MGVDVTFYIGGFTGLTKENEEVIKAAAKLTYDDCSMSLSPLDTPLSRYKSEDGFCVVHSLARAYRDSYEEMRQEQVVTLKELFPGHSIYKFNDLDDRDEVVELIKQDPDHNRVV